MKNNLSLAFAARILYSNISGRYVAWIFLLCMGVLIVAGCGGPGSGSGMESSGNSSAPTLNSIGDKTITLGDPPLTFTVSATDPNNLMLMYSSDGSVMSGANPYTETGSLASFDPNSRQFSWDVTGVNPADYYVQFSVMNSNGESDSEIIRIRVQTQPSEFEIGQQKYDASCRTCHGPEGRDGDQGLIQCIDSMTYYGKINGGSMSSYVRGWTDAEKAAVLFYLDNVNPGAC